MQSQIHSTDGASRQAARHDHRGWRRSLAQALILGALLLSAVLLYRTLSKYDFGDVTHSVHAVGVWRLFEATGWAAASYLCLTVNDWIALRYARQPLPYRTAALTSFVALSFGHNIGFAALSSGAIRYRFYARFGLGAEEMAKIIAFCGTTIFLGMFVLGVFALFARPDLAAALTGMSAKAICILGAALALVPVIYLILAAVLRRKVQIFRWRIEMPGLLLAIAQIAVGVLNFLFVGACLYSAVSSIADVSYFEVLFAFVLANTATIITHTPGGLGVIETVVLLLLKRPDLIGAVLVFRFVYFLVPLSLGAAVLAIAETTFRSRHSSRQAAGASGGEERSKAHGAARVEQSSPELQPSRAPT
jgi:uncharacterized membrane protein YbhN (UPF0104 family)